MNPHSNQKTPFPTMAEVEAAGHLQLAEWYRFLVSPANKKEQRIMKRMIDRFHAEGRSTPAVGKAVNGRPKARRKR